MVATACAVVVGGLFVSQVGSTANLASVSCAADATLAGNSTSDCAMAVDDTKFNVTGESLDCGVCNLAGEPIVVAGADGTSNTTTPGIPVTSCEELKAEIETGASGTFDIVQDMTCSETIKIADGQEVALTSSGADAPFRISSGEPFVGGTSVSTSTEEDGGAGDDHSMFVVEEGGALDASSIIFDTAASGTPDEEGSATTTTSSATTTSATNATGATAGGVRAIYNAGNLTVADCEFQGSGPEATQQVANGGAVRW